MEEGMELKELRKEFKSNIDIFAIQVISKDSDIYPYNLTLKFIDSSLTTLKTYETTIMQKNTPILVEISNVRTIVANWESSTWDIFNNVETIVPIDLNKFIQLKSLDLNRRVHGRLQLSFLDPLEDYNLNPQLNLPMGTSTQDRIAQLTDNIVQPTKKWMSLSNENNILDNSFFPVPKFLSGNQVGWWSSQESLSNNYLLNTKPQLSPITITSSMAQTKMGNIGIYGNTLKNELKNSSFAHGNKYWNIDNVENYSIVDETLTMNTEKYGGKVSQVISNINSYRGHLVYVRADVYAKSKEVGLVLDDGSQQHIKNVSYDTAFYDWGTLSNLILISDKSTTLTVSISDYTIDTETILCKNFMLIDLTAIFGANREPSLELCNDIPYFDGVRSVGEQLYQIQKIKTSKTFRNFVRDNNFTSTKDWETTDIVPLRVSNNTLISTHSGRTFGSSATQHYGNLTPGNAHYFSVLIKGNPKISRLEISLDYRRQDSVTILELDELDNGLPSEFIRYGGVMRVPSNYPTGAGPTLSISHYYNTPEEGRGQKIELREVMGIDLNENNNFAINDEPTAYWCKQVLQWFPARDTITASMEQQRLKKTPNFIVKTQYSNNSSVEKYLADRPNGFDLDTPLKKWDYIKNGSLFRQTGEVVIDKNYSTSWRSEKLANSIVQFNKNFYDAAPTGYTSEEQKEYIVLSDIFPTLNSYEGQNTREKEGIFIRGAFLATLCINIDYHKLLNYGFKLYDTSTYVSAFVSWINDNPFKIYFKKPQSVRTDFLELKKMNLPLYESGKIIFSNTIPGLINLNPLHLGLKIDPPTTPKTMSNLILVGDSLTNNYPVDFTLTLYKDGLEIDTIKVENNQEVEYKTSVDLSKADYYALDIYKLSKSNDQVRLLEFSFSSTITYLDDNIFSINTVHSCNFDNEDVPLGNIVSNTVNFEIANFRNDFDLSDDKDSFTQYLTEGREIKIDYGLDVNSVSQGPRILWIPQGTFYSQSWNSQPDNITLQCYGADVCTLLDNVLIQTDEVFINKTWRQLWEELWKIMPIKDFKYSLSERIDFMDTIIPYYWFGKISFRKAIENLLSFTLCTAYVDVTNTLIIYPSNVTQSALYTHLNNDSALYAKEYPSAFRSSYNKVKVTGKNFKEVSTEDIFGEKGKNPILLSDTTGVYEYDIEIPNKIISYINFSAVNVKLPINVTVDREATKICSWGIHLVINQRRVIKGTYLDLTNIPGRYLESSDIVIIEEDKNAQRLQGIREYVVDTNIIQDYGMAYTLALQVFKYIKTIPLGIEVETIGVLGLSPNIDIVVPNVDDTSEKAYVTTSIDSLYDGGLESTIRGRVLN